MNSIEESRRKPQVDPCSLLWERARRNPILVHRPRLAQNIQGQSRPSRSSPFFAGCSTSSEGHASIQPAERLKAERACWACWRQWSACLLKPALSLIRHSTVLAGLTQSEFSCQHPAITIPRARPGWHAGVGDRTAHALSRSFSNDPSHPKDIHLAIHQSHRPACTPLSRVSPLPPLLPRAPIDPPRYFCPRNPATAPGAIELIPSMRRETVAEAALQFAWTCFCEFPKPSLGAVLHALLQSAADLLLPSTICKDVARSW